ncbi:MAG: hypothetical protein ACREJD_17740 [Phycisphaerales bacterium]
MKRVIDVSLVVFFVAALVWCTRQIAFWRAGVARAADARMEWTRVSGAAAELSMWRAKPALVSESHTPSQLLLAMVSDAGASTGISASAIKSVEGERDRPVAGAPPAFKQQSLRVQFESVPLPDLGRFLQRWRATNPTWPATSIDLSPANSGRPDPIVKWNSRLVFENVYLSK